MSSEKAPEQDVVGHWRLDFLPVQLVAVYAPGGGSFYLSPEQDNRTPSRIKVSTDYGSWEECMNVLMHEALELAFTLRNLRYRPSGDLTMSHANYLFVMTHEDFTSATAAATQFLVDALPQMQIAYWRHVKIRTRLQKAKKAK